MKNNIVEILNFILKKHILRNKNVETTSAVIDENIMQQLESAGFVAQDVYDAFTWFINSLMQQCVNKVTEKSDAIRLFTPGEMDKVGEEGCSCLLFLERVGVLNAKTREIVIAQLMQLPQEQYSLDEIKWIVLMVLLNQNEKNEENNLLEKYALYLGHQYAC